MYLETKKPCWCDSCNKEVADDVKCVNIDVTYGEYSTAICEKCLREAIALIDGGGIRETVTW